MKTIMNSYLNVNFKYFSFQNWLIGYIIKKVQVLITYNGLQFHLKIKKYINVFKKFKSSLLSHQAPKGLKGRNILKINILCKTQLLFAHESTGGHCCPPILTENSIDIISVKSCPVWRNRTITTDHRVFSKAYV